MNQREVQGLPDEQRLILQIGLARLLANNLNIKRVDPGKWEAVLTSDNDEITGAEIMKNLQKNNPFNPPIKEAYEKALGSILTEHGETVGTIELDENASQLVDRHSQWTEDAHMRALIVFDEEPLFLLRYGKGPTKDEVMQKCEAIGIKINGKAVPIIPWTVANICSDYDIRFGFRQFGIRSLKKAT